MVTAAVCLLLAAVAVVLWVSRDEPPAGMLTPVQISQLRTDRTDQLLLEEWRAVHSQARDSAGTQQAG